MSRSAWKILGSRFSSRINSSGSSMKPGSTSGTSAETVWKSVLAFMVSSKRSPYFPRLITPTSMSKNIFQRVNILAGGRTFYEPVRYVVEDPGCAHRGHPQRRRQDHGYPG